MAGFLVDESLPRAVSAALVAAQFDSRDARDVGLRGRPDDEVARRAREEDRILVTADLDFSNTLRFPPGSHPGIVVSRLPDTLAPEVVAARIVDVVRQSGDALRGATTIVEPTRVRAFTRA